MQWALDSSFNTLNGNSGHQNRELTGTLTLYSHPSLVQCLLLPRIGDFIAQHPTIHLNILTGREIINGQPRRGLGDVLRQTALGAASGRGLYAGIDGADLHAAVCRRT